MRSYITSVFVSPITTYQEKYINISIGFFINNQRGTACTGTNEKIINYQSESTDFQPIIVMKNKKNKNEIEKQELGLY